MSLELASMLLGGSSIVVSALAAFVASRDMLRKSTATTRLRRRNTRTHPSRTELQELLAALHDLEKSGQLLAVGEVQSRVLELRDVNNALALAISELSEDEQKAVIEILSNPSDVSRQRYLESTLGA